MIIGNTDGCRTESCPFNLSGLYSLFAHCVIILSVFVSRLTYCKILTSVSLLPFFFQSSATLDEKDSSIISETVIGFIHS